MPTSVFVSACLWLRNKYEEVDPVWGESATGWLSGCAGAIAGAGVVVLAGVGLDDLDELLEVVGVDHAGVDGQHVALVSHGARGFLQTSRSTANLGQKLGRLAVMPGL